MFISCFRLIRTSILLTLACCYLMWTVTYLSQVHPLDSEFGLLVSAMLS